MTKRKADQSFKKMMEQANKEAREKKEEEGETEQWENDQKEVEEVEEVERKISPKQLRKRKSPPPKKPAGKQKKAKAPPKSEVQQLLGAKEKQEEIIKMVSFTLETNFPAKQDQKEHTGCKCLEGSSSCKHSERAGFPRCLRDWDP